VRFPVVVGASKKLSVLQGKRKHRGREGFSNNQPRYLLKTKHLYMTRLLLLPFSVKLLANESKPVGTVNFPFQKTLFPEKVKNQ